MDQDDGCTYLKCIINKKIKGVFKESNSDLILGEIFLLAENPIRNRIFLLNIIVYCRMLKYTLKNSGDLAL